MQRQILYIKNKDTKLSILKLKHGIPILVCSDYDRVMSAMCSDLNSQYTVESSMVIELLPLLKMTGAFKKVIKEAKKLGFL